MENAIAEAKKYIKTFFESDFSGHDYYHSIRVYRTAIQLAREEGANLNIVALAALLHDVDDIKLSPDTHGVKQNAVNFLKSMNIPESDIVNICQIIDEISFKGSESTAPSSLEGKCVQDADRLDAIGAIGIARMFAYGGSRSRPIYDPEIKPRLGMNAKEYHGHIAPSFNHFYEKLFLLKDMMNTESGKHLAASRDKFMHEFVDHFLDEWGEG